MKKNNAMYDTLESNIQALNGIADLANFWNDTLLIEIGKCRNNNKSTIEECRSLIDIISIYNRKCLNGYTKLLEEDKENTKYAKLFNTFVEASRTHLNLLQDKLNQLIYKKQRCEYRVSMIIAVVALIFTVVFGFCQKNTTCSCCFIETEQTKEIPKTENSKVYNDKALPLLDTINKAK